MAKVSKTKKELKKNLTPKKQTKKVTSKTKKPIPVKKTSNLKPKKIVTNPVKAQENKIPFLLLTPEEVVTKIKNLFKKKPKPIIKSTKKPTKVTKKKLTILDKIKSIFIKKPIVKSKKTVTKKPTKVIKKKLTIIDKLKSLFIKQPKKKVTITKNKSTVIKKQPTVIDKLKNLFVPKKVVTSTKPVRKEKQVVKEEGKKELADFFITSDFKLKNKVILVIISFLFGLLIGFIPFINYKPNKGVITDNTESCSYTEWVKEDVKYCIISTDGKYYESDYMKYEKLPDSDKCIRYTRRKKC